MNSREEIVMDNFPVLAGLFENSIVGDSRVFSALWVPEPPTVPLTRKSLNPLYAYRNRVDFLSGNKRRSSFDIGIAGNKSMSSMDFAAVQSTAIASDRGKTSNAAHTEVWTKGIYG